MVFGEESELLGWVCRWCLGRSRSCLAGCGKLGNDNPLLLLSGSFVGVAVLLASWLVCWGESELLVGDKLGNDSPLPLSLVALWVPGVS
uniref:Uncharacterized protein n=1 Tax=Oryza barthii TaxID=65489 RepID=A0A0D3HBI8_9ORYZ